MNINDQIIGKCSNCGGKVAIPYLWYGVIPPKPTCQKCGAQAKEKELDIIDMEPSVYKK